MRNRTVLATAVALLCFNSKPSSALENGWHADPSFHPYVGTFVYDFSLYRDDSAGCGAVLIHPNAVLTAAHCLDRRADDETYLRIKRVSFDPVVTSAANTVEINWAAIQFLHNPDIDCQDGSRSQPELAIVPLRTSPSPNPFTLSTSTVREPQEGDLLLFFGYGPTDRGTKSYGDYQVCDVSDAQTVYVDAQIGYDGVNPVRTHQGDSGGPSFWVNKQMSGVHPLRFCEHGQPLLAVAEPGLRIHG